MRAKKSKGDAKFLFRLDSPTTACVNDDGVAVGAFATAEDGNAIARAGVGELYRHGAFSLRGASAQVLKCHIKASNI